MVDQDLTGSYPKVKTLLLQIKLCESLLHAHKNELCVEVVKKILEHPV